MSHRTSRKKIALTPLTDEKSGRLLFITCFICYFLFVGTRNYYGQAMAQIVPSGLFTKDVAGMVSSAYMLFYGIGMFVNGLLSEKIQPFLFISISLGLSAGANALMYAYSLTAEPSIVPFIIIWAIAGYSQSAAWPMMIRTVSTLMPEKSRTKAGANLYIASCSGDIAAYLISQQILRISNWQSLFLFASAVGAVLCIFFTLATRGISKRCVCHEAVDDIPEKTPDIGAKSTTSLFSLMLLSGGATILCSIAFKSLAYDGLKGWIPTMLAESFSVDASFSVMISTVVPICNVAGVFLGRLVYERLLGSEVKTAALFMTLGSAALALISLIGFTALPVLIVILAFSIPIISGASTMYISLAPLRFARYGRSGTVAGLFNAVCCACSGISSFMIGVLSQSRGWQTTLFVLAALMLTGGIFSLLTIGKWKRFRDM